MMAIKFTPVEIIQLFVIIIAMVYLYVAMVALVAVMPEHKGGKYLCNSFISW